MRALTIFGWALAALAVGALAFELSLPSRAPDVSSHMYSVHKYWYMGRSSGFAAYALLLCSVLLGVGVSSRVFDGWLVRPWVYDMHQFLSIAVLVVMAFHALIMLPDPYAQFRLTELLVPFTSQFKPVWVGLGAISLYGSVILTASFYVKKRIGQRGWRVLHYASFAFFVMAYVHGIKAGTDTGEAWAQVVYLVSGLTVAFFTFFRVLAVRSVKRKDRAAVAAAREPVRAQAIVAPSLPQQES
jgi:predicted ferric reductase